MNHNLLYVILSLVFVITGAAAVLLALWGRRLSTRSRALSSRLGAIALRRRQHQPEQLLKSEAIHPLLWLQWILTHAPGVTQLSLLIQRSGSQQTLAQVMLSSAALGFLAWLLPIWLLQGRWVVSFVSGLAAFSLPTLYLMQQEKKRRLRFEDQLPEALDFIARALRAGHGLSVAMGMVGEELPDPVGAEFKTTFEHINLGMTFDDAMGELADRIHSNDLNFLVIALTIQRKTGGNLTELLSTLARTVRERIKLKGKIRVLASEGKLSGLMIGSLPFILGIILSLINPLYMATLWTTETGRTLVLAGLVMMCLGGLWMWKIVQIKV